MSFEVHRMLSKLKYHYVKEAKKDIGDVLQQYRNLHASIEKCTLPTGVQRELVVLKGTIPVTFKKIVYNIPISIWILGNHPESAPYCWVNPTKDMTIRVSQHVDNFGRVYLPYLSNWTSQTSDLLGVIQVMIILFGENPPLFMKPKKDEDYMRSSMTDYSPSSSSQNPPYPTQYPDKYPYMSVYPAVNPVSTSSTTPGYPPSSTADSSSSSIFSYPSFPMMPVPNYQPSQPSSQTINSETITPKHIHLSLVSACEDKLKARAKEIYSQYKAEVDVLKKTSEDLTKGRSKLDTVVENIETNLVELSKCKENLIERNAKLNETLSKIESKDSFDIDEYFGPIQPLYKQLFNAFVEENAIIDTIFYLNEALQKNVIDLDVFLKYIRELSRRQFMLRALVKLCREKAKLPA
ncbi:hypothetical protein NH340_JMT01631 [Sarcoptes scabiei]|nr:hypothetical protein NH340_JMT01631 [Sarcoptes scabiei]